MFCSISGEIPQDPVVSKLTGHVYEKKLVLKYLVDQNKCPVTGAPLSEDDLISLQLNKSIKPRPISATSIPGLLATFQNEWDEVMLETFTLKQQLDTTRQELSQALYQNDAACRVIARLMRERDEARASLEHISATIVPTTKSAQNNGNSVSGPNHMDTTDTAPVSTEQDTTVNGITETVIAALNDKCKDLSATRKSRKPQPEGILSIESIGSLSESTSFTPHTTAKGGVTALAISRSPSDPSGAYILSGGIDKVAIISNKEGNVLGKLSGHTKKITDVSFHVSEGLAGLFFTASADKSVKIWTKGTKAGSFSAQSTASHHQNSVTGLTLHPSGDYLVSSSLDGSWAFLDVATGGTLLRQVYDHSSGEHHASSGLLGCQFHPDGLILATSSVSNLQFVGKEDDEVYADSCVSVVRIWDTREQKHVTQFEEHTKVVRNNAISFSENGYYVATGCDDGYVRLWDLRKLKCIKTIEAMGPVSAVSFDYSGLYVAAASGSGSTYGVNIYSSKDKDWGSIKTLSNIHSKPISSLDWSLDSSCLYSGSLDRAIRVFQSSAMDS